MNIRSLIKKNNLTLRLAQFVRRQLYSFEMLKYRNLPVINQVLFINFNGRGYGDNPKAIAEKLHEADPSIKMVWAVKNKDESVPDYIDTVKFETKDYFQALSVSRVWVSNVFLPEGTRKRKDQLYIQTWHGDRAMKKILNDAADDLDSYKKRHGRKTFFESKNCDYITTGSRFGEELFRSSADYRGKYITSGCPRNDRLISCSSQEIRQIREKLHIHPDQKILLFAPTFRDSKRNSEANDSDIDLGAILDKLEEKYHCDWKCILRAHSGSRLIRNQNENDSRFVDMTSYPDMTDLLLITDFLITDYSSCATDFILTGKPLMLYQDDIKEYTSSSRTLYYSPEDTCFSAVMNMEDALKAIDSMDEHAYREQDLAIAEYYGTYETGHSAEECAAIILDEIYKQQSGLLKSL